MAKLSKEQINELKNKGLITSTDNSELLANQSVDDLKDKEYITQVIPSSDIEESITPSTENGTESESK